MTTSNDHLDKTHSRRSILRIGALGIAGGALLAACGDDDDDGGGAASGSSPEPSTTPSASATGSAKELKLIQGWYKGREVEYYDFGANTKLTTGSSIGTAPIYVMITGMNADGSPKFVEGQNNIIAVKPGDQGYSDLWRVMLVSVPASYKANELKSASAVMAARYGITETNMFVNCPVVAEGTTLEGGEKLVQGWYNGDEVFYPDFGANPPVAIPIWAFATGMDAQGNPKLVTGQNNIIDSTKGDPGYSAFWRVNLVMVPESYSANSIKSADAVRSSGHTVMQTDIVVNCPVV
ncbi:MAG TPA: hypothetical protein VG845_07490 [Dehalococcoidia bacterium]|nr:hypothetical protein [Dehalococcoidia bacterium]